MGGSVFTYSAVITKLRAMSAGLLNRSDYELLMAKPRVADVVSWLKQHSGCSAVLADVNENTVHRGTLERIFYQAVLRDGEKISKMLGSGEAQMLRVFLERTEVDFLKRVIRLELAHAQAREELLLLLPTRKMAFDPALCLQAQNLPELVESLAGSGYDRVLEPFLSTTQESTFAMENALDVYYFNRLKESAEKYLSRQDAKDTLDFISAEIDVHNILRVYRYKKYYAFDKEEILQNLLPNHYRLKKEALHRLAEADIRDFGKMVADTRYGNLFSSDSDLEWDKRVSEYLYQLYTKRLRQNGYNFTTVIAYFYRKEMDIDNIITIVEGVRYSLDPDKIRTYLVS